MNYQIGHSIMLLIQTSLDGGLSQFVRDGGSLAVVPNEIIIYHPKIPQMLLEKLTESISASSNLHLTTSSVPNFCFYDNDVCMEKARQTIERALHYVCTDIDAIVVGRAAVILSAEKAFSESESIRDITTALRTIKGLYRARLLCQNGLLNIDMR